MTEESKKSIYWTAGIIGVILVAIFSLARRERVSGLVKGIRVGVGMKVCVEVLNGGAHLLALLTATPTRIRLTDLLPSVAQRESQGRSR